MPGNRPHHTDKWRSCVDKVMAQGHDESSASAICTKSLQDAGEDIFVAAGENGMTDLRYLHLLGATGTSRTAMYDGRPHLVVPVVALMEGVIHAVNASTPEFVSAATLQKAAATWNGRPVTLGHPVKGGKQCSANEPHVMSEHMIGTIFNSHVDGKKLLCEAWIDQERAKKLHPEMYDRLLANKTEEVSVGAYVVTDETPGNFNGKPFKASWLQTTGDHLAFLPGGRGACSVEMGCGTHRAAMRVCEEGLELLSNPEGINQYTKGGGKGATSAEDKMKNPSDTSGIEPPPILNSETSSTGHTSATTQEGRIADMEKMHYDEIQRVVKRSDSLITTQDSNTLYPNPTDKYSYITTETSKGLLMSQVFHDSGNVKHLWHDGEKILRGKQYRGAGALPDKAQVAIEGGRMKVGDKVKIHKPGHAAHGKTGIIKASSAGGMVHTVGDHGTFHQSALRAAQAFDTPEQAASEEAAELIAYTSMRTLLDGVGTQWDEASGLVDELIADEEENPTETAAQEEAETEVEGARLEAIRMLCYAMASALQNVISITYEETNNANDVPQPADPRYMEAFKALYGKSISAANMKTIQAAHDTSHTMHDSTTALGAACNGMKLLAGVIQPASQMEDCPTCAGSGNRDGNPCPACEGNGHVLKAAAGGPQLKAACRCEGESTMEKKAKAELIAALVTDKHSGFKEGDEPFLETATDARLGEFKAASEANKAAAEKAMKDENALRASEAKLTVTEGKLKAAEQAPTEEQWLERAPAGIKTLLENQKAQDGERRDELVKLLKVAGANTEDELKAMPTAQLETLAKYAKVETVDFSGRGLPQERAAASAEDDKQYDPPNPWAAGIKALQEQGAKAAN